jgi:RES domain-containing protein
MVLWRISRNRDLNGNGGQRASGRWHFAGQPVVYLSENPAAALLEVCVHTAANDVPPEFTLLKVVGPEVEIALIEEGSLPQSWQSRFDITRGLGTDWLQRRETILLKLPSAIVPHTWNFLFNPLHPDADRFAIAEARRYPFDSRIKE